MAYDHDITLSMRSVVQQTISLVALPFCVNNVVSDDQFQRMFFRLCRSLDLVLSKLTMAMPYWLASLPTYSIACSPCSTLQLGQLPVFVVRLRQQTLASFHLLRVASKLSSNWLSSTTELFTSLHLGTCLIGWVAMLTCRLGIDFGSQLPTNLLSVGRVLANDHLLLLAQSCRTVFQMLYRWQCFGEN